MFSTSRLHRFFAQAALLLLLSLCMSACNGQTEEPANPTDQFADASEMVVFQTDSTEWRVRLFKEHVLYSEVASITMPAQWRLPTREEAQILKTLTYPHDERFVTSDGYTFAMPSATVSKAGAKTKYSVLGLYIRKSTIKVEF